MKLWPGHMMEEKSCAAASLAQTSSLSRHLLRCRALYAVLASGDVAHTNKAAMFLSLLFKAMQADISNARVCAFVKRLLQVAMHQQPNFACGCLMITSQLLQVRAARLGRHPFRPLS